MKPTVFPVTKTKRHKDSITGKCGFLASLGLPLFFLILFSASSNSLMAKPLQPANKTQKTKNDSSKVRLDTLKFYYSLPQSELFHLGDYDLAKWMTHLPHTWVTRSPQFGQPQMLQGIATPFWLSAISWNEIQMVDPVYGIMDLNFLPVIPIDYLVSNSGIHIINKQITTSRPFSQVFYHTGDNGLSDVDVMFRRGFSKGIQFQAGANFFKFGGIYSNSNADIFKLNSGIFIPLTQKIQLSYKFLSDKITAGYPGSIAPNYQVQFFKLHRKVDRQDHLLNIFYNRDSLWQTNIQLQLHQDVREYTDWSLPWHSIEKLRWADFSAQITKKSASSRTIFKIKNQAVFASRLGMKKIQEFPIGLSLSHQLITDSESEIHANAGFMFYNQTWQGYFAEISGKTKLQNKAVFSTTAFYRQQVPPLGWRKGRILPFENQPWPFLFLKNSFESLSKNVPEEPVIESGLRFKIHWQATSNLELYSDFLLQQVQNLSFPQALKTNKIEFTNVPAYYTTGLFLNAKYFPFHWLSFSGSYQYAGVFERLSPDLLEIPDHWFYLQLHITKYLFQRNLKANLFVYNEFLSQRWSYGLYSDFSRFLIEPLKAKPLLHVKLLFEIGDAEIFIHWNNLTNQTYAYRSQQRIPGWQFQFGVRWKFWD